MKCSKLIEVMMDWMKDYMHYFTVMGNIYAQMVSFGANLIQKHFVG